MWKFIIKIFQDPSSIQFKIFHDILALIILISTIFVTLESVPEIAEKYKQLFWRTDIIIVIIFTIEYILRISTAKKTSGIYFQ